MSSDLFSVGYTGKSIGIIADNIRFEYPNSVAYTWFQDRCLKPHGYSFADCVYYKPGSAVPIQGHKFLFLLGQQALKLHSHHESIDQTRGTGLVISGIPAIATYHPQNAFDYKRDNFDFEDEDDEGDGKDFMPTRPGSYRFWIKMDAEKLLKRGFEAPQKLECILNPPLDPIIDKLLATKGKTLYLDIENQRESKVLSCVGIAIDDSKVAVVPIYRYTGRLAHPKMYQFLAALSIAMCHNRVVVHNCFHDLIVLAAYYRLPYGNDLFDTMVASHRAFQEAEKSLGHVISLWTWQPFHKNQNIMPHNFNQEKQHWTYNANDVHGMRLVYKAQLKAMEADAGLKASIIQAMESLPVYLYETIRGFRYHENTLYTHKWNNYRRRQQLLRVCRTLKQDPKFNPVSSKQCVSFFHHKLGYPVVARSKRTGAPSLDNKALYLLRLRNNNPLIDAIIAYREVEKERTMLEFTPWRLPCLNNGSETAQSQSQCSPSSMTEPTLSPTS